MSKKILVIGDYDEGKWHPLTDVDKQLEKILVGCDVKCTQDYTALTPCDLKAYDLLICYTDAWRARGTHELAGSILSYVADGGALLSIHSGIIMRNTPEMEMMQGASFTGHPAACDLTYTPAAGNHPVIDGIGEFVIFEEPYRFTMANLAEPEILLTYAYEDKSWEAAWTLPYGKGSVVYLSMGHSAKSFDSAMFAKMIVNSANWLMSK